VKELQQEFLQLRFGMFIHFNLETFKGVQWISGYHSPADFNRQFALVPMPHIQQGWNNCGATSCAMLARTQGKKLGGWDFKPIFDSI
jgi:hypothetical protein